MLAVHSPIDPGWVGAIVVSLGAVVGVSRWTTRLLKSRAERIEENDRRWTVVLGAPPILDHEGNEISPARDGLVQRVSRLERDHGTKSRPTTAR